MSVSIPASDAASTNLNTTITTLGTLITAAGNNGPLVARLTQQKAEAQFALVMHLIGAGHLSCASILTNETYVSNPISDGV
jgi:hypothetical protein